MFKTKRRSFKRVVTTMLNYISVDSTVGLANIYLLDSDVYMADKVNVAPHSIARVNAQIIIT